MITNQGLSADAVVVGGGVIGCAVAYELARGGWQVVVVDKGASPGHGSTSASSAIVRFNYSTFDGTAAAWEAFHCWQTWPDLVGGTAGDDLATLVRTGVAILDVPLIPRHRHSNLFARAGVPYEEWDADTLRQRIPGLYPGKFWPPKPIDDAAFWADPDAELGAMFTPDGGFVQDPVLATQNLADAAARLGVRFLFKSTVTHVRRVAGRVTGLSLADGELITAPTVVNCAGPWSSQLNELAGVGSDFTVSVRPMRQEVHHVKAPPGYNTPDRLGPVVADLDLGTYMRAAPGDAMMIGGTEPECDPLEWLDNPDLANPNRTAAQFETQVTRAARRFPQLGVPAQPKGIAGVYDVTSDWTPIYDRTELDGFYVAIGTSGNQFKNAPVVGRMMATLINAVANGRNHDADPVAYKCEHTENIVNLGAFSRMRQVNQNSSGTVFG